MLYIESPEEAQAISRRALEMMGQHQIPANPVNFTLWYSYLIGSPPGLKAEVDKIWAEGGAVDGDLSATLFARFFGDGEPGAKIAEAGLAIEAQLEQVLSYLGEASADTSGFGEKLADLSVDLVKGAESGDVGAVVRNILLETQKIVSKSKAMEQKLSESSEEIHQLRENLNAELRPVKYLYATIAGGLRFQRLIQIGDETPILILDRDLGNLFEEEPIYHYDRIVNSVQVTGTRTNSDGGTEEFAGPLYEDAHSISIHGRKAPTSPIKLNTDNLMELFDRAVKEVEARKNLAR